ncbi:MAG: hypothetical protein R3200_10865 [Xanthomonadales bacterium]|nr:hypothetical protein [Xanthomonadales bacterium]
MFVTVFFLAACAGGPRERLELARDIESHDSIGVLPINFMEKPEARVYSNPVKFAGTVGRIAVAKADDTTRRKFSTALDEARYSYQEDVSSKLIERLQEAGFDAEYMEFNRSIDNVLGAVPPGQFERRYPKDTGYDLLLDVYVEYFGYAAPSLGEDYLPTGHIAVRVVDGATLDTVYQSEIHYHPMDPEAEVVKIEADRAYTFEEFEDILNDIPKAREGLKAATQALMAALVDELSGA